jgi:DNA gyrase subunit A
VPVNDDDELMMMTARGKIQRVAVSDFSIIGRNTQGVRIMSLDEGDALAAIVRVPPEEKDDAEIEPSAEAHRRRMRKPSSGARPACLAVAGQT